MVMLLKILEVTFIAVASILTSSNGQGPTQSSGPVSGPLPGPDSGVCLTGQMKNVQSWTDDIGTIIADTDADTEREAIDLSSKRDPETILMQSMIRTVGPKKRVGFLSMARCQLTSVPPVFGYRDSGNRSLSNTLQFLTLYGNQFDDNGLPGQRYDVMINATNATKQKLKIASFDKQEKSTWDVGFRNVRFPDLLELDLRSCRIQRLNGGIFDGMPSLQSLYLAENQIYYIGEKSFSKLSNLLHLDLSHNTAIDQKGSKVVLEWESGDVFSCLSNLRSLDLSLTPLSENSAAVFENLGKRFQRLSLCNTGVTNLKPYNFEKTSMKILDLSGNTGIMNDRRALEGLQSSLQVLYADSVGLKTLESLMHFTELQILKVSHNEISVVESEMTKTWPSLRILDLDNNKLNSWSGKVFSRLHNLDILSMRNNNINLIKARMLHDLRNVSYLAMSGNFFVCTCYNREFFEIAANNEKNYQAPNNMLNASVTNNVTKHHVGYYEFYNKIINRNIVKRDCGNKMHGKKKLCGHEVNSDIDGVFLLIDYERNFYNCFLIDKAETMEFSQVEPCNVAQRDLIYDEYIKVGWRKVVVIGTSVTLAMVLLILGYVFRRSFWYFYITVKNSALLSLMAESEGYEDGSIFNYDVFVSYCNEDRPWVLDHLLPHVEKDCNVSVCLHERDFQVGLSILENIVSCMDRSRSIMLVISQRFLLSQWCQFEMHLAQHRLLETRREDLILILLEDIPRRLRPNTLHYLMMTKTYVLWPKDPTEQTIFWKRLKKSLVTRKLKQTDNDSLA